MPTVVLVDDHAANVEIYRQVLGSLPGLQVVCFTDPVRALEWCSRSECAAAIIDYRMPVVDGLEFTRLLRKVKGRALVPVIMLTGVNDPGLRVQAKALGIAELLNKPVKSVDFIRCVQNTLRIEARKHEIARLRVATQLRNDARRRALEHLLRGVRIARIARLRRIAEERLQGALRLLRQSLRVRKRVAAAAALTAAALLASLALAAHAPARQSASVAATAPPHAAAQHDAALAKAQQQLAQEPLLAGNASFALIDSHGRLLLSRNPDAALIPASSLKAITAAGALNGFGSGHRFTTRLTADGQPAAGHIGSLTLVGSGDPLLSSADIDEAALAVAAAGIRSVDHGVSVDASLISAPEQNPAWDQSDASSEDAPGASAVSLDGGNFDLAVTGSASAGAPAGIAWSPRGPAPNVSGTVQTAGSGGASVSVSAGEPGFYIVSGHVPMNQTVHYQRPIVGMAALAGSVLAATLASQQINVGDPNVALPSDYRRRDAQRTIWSHESRPVGELVRRMLVYSDNHVAEQLFRLSGARSAGGGTMQNARDAQMAVMTRAGVDTSRMRIVDGSGLSRQNRVSARALAQVLQKMQSDDAAREFYGALPLVGQEGTVANHALGAARGRVRAKSGTLTGVHSLAGYVRTATRGVVGFSYITNEPQPDAAVLAGENRVLDLMAKL